jgi:hypothetical protein
MTFEDEEGPAPAMLVGRVFLVRFKQWTERGWYEAELIGKVLDWHPREHRYLFDLRPVAGTATIYDRDIITAIQARDPSRRVKPHRVPEGQRGRY